MCQWETADVLQVGCQCELSLKILGTNLVDLEAAISTPSGQTECCEIQKLDERVTSIKFVPRETGVHTVHVKHKGLHMPG
jgi:filamin